MKTQPLILNPDDAEIQRLSELLLMKEYSSNSFLFMDNPARTLNIYSNYKPSAATKHSVLPERRKKSKFTFVELVWIKMVHDLRGFGVDFEIIRQLKDFLFSTPDKTALLEEIEKKKKDFDNLFENLSLAERERLYTELKKRMSIDMSNQELRLSYLLIILINSIFLKIPIELRIYLNGSIALYSDSPDGNLVPFKLKPGLLNKSFISLSLTGIISYYLTEDIISPGSKENFFSDAELDILNTINKDNLKSIKITYKDEKADFIEIEKVKVVNINQRVAELFLTGAYEDVTVKTQNGKIVNCKKIQRIKIKDTV